ncbi:pyridoxal phosphate-dependent aminotransferase [Phyllobacterium sp. 0TCS1.6C]|jgi:aspartate/methionine/tyrosine aminotransferase|uniref:pyridoxal phosphate-dependent aminotransferase n=1 Tax=unclassified Phyllobacterium TaxID=2638441 RepID=UPI0022650725|nr:MULTISPECIES: pyridoxal phosphate-dependent aminotransferase [unclassified Phyllobacterium]MCX8281956.1 pyridoxal phosphate-dependent aminotransferase [Phyllobacterium sp. 0TCS1.6C]MCX8294419.1 pyridoxal phosphate-dependent aminotransferase [Phyllobacterium sp. 0TCS1.6A]
MSLIQHLRHEAAAAPESGIVAVMNHGRRQENVIPLWAGEGDLPTPDFIRDAANRGLANGETFYTWQAGIPELRQALSDYYHRHFALRLPAEHFYVTGSGMQSIQLAIQATAGTGDEVIYLSPAWPNFAAAAAIGGARPVAVTQDFTGNGWSLDPQKIKDKITPRTKALFINTPTNPSGWTADIETLKEILAMARANGLWIIADEIYSQFYYGGRRAPSFLDVMDAEDRIIFVNSFSKNWAMTGWRVGWLVVHPSLGTTIENLIQYSTSGVAQFMQRGAVAALDEGDEFVRMQVERARQARDILCARLIDTGRVRLSPPAGAFYLFFGIDGITDSYRAAFDIVDQAKVGLAPGTAFGEGGEAFLRLCFARRLDQIETAADRLAEWIKAR